MSERLVGVGIGMVGPLDYRLGVVRDAHGLRHWHDVPLRDLAAARLGVPVIVDKDTTAGRDRRGLAAGRRRSATPRWSWSRPASAPGCG